MAPGAAVVRVPGTEVSVERLSSVDAILDNVPRAVSVDTEAKAQEVLGLLSKSGMDYFWTSGIKHKGSDDSVRWANGASGRITPGSYPW